MIAMQLTDTGMNNIMMSISAVAIMARGVMFPCTPYLLLLILMLCTNPIHTQEDQNMILLDGTGPIYTLEELDISLVDGRVLIVQQDQREHTIQGMRTGCPLMDMINTAILCMVHTMQWDLLLLLCIPPFWSAATAHINLTQMLTWKGVEQHIVAIIESMELDQLIHLAWDLGVQLQGQLWTGMLLALSKQTIKQEDDYIMTCLIFSGGI